MKDHALGYWITKLALGQPKAGKGRFVAVEVNPVSPAQQVAGAVHVGVTRIVLPDGTRIESQEGDMSALATLAALIRGRMAP